MTASIRIECTDPLKLSDAVAALVAAGYRQTSARTDPQQGGRIHSASLAPNTGAPALAALIDGLDRNVRDLKQRLAESPAIARETADR